MQSSEFKGEVISGKKAISKVKRLSNNGQMKKMFNGYIKNKVKSTNSINYDKKDFIPFVDERDHLG